jgi:hypothetical protein
MAEQAPLTTPDGRYIIVRGRLWRRANPGLAHEHRQELVGQLMAARRQVALALRHGDETTLKAAREGVQRAKEGLGERGPVWWDDGSPDYTRRLARNTPYKAWYESLNPGDAG